MDNICLQATPTPVKLEYTQVPDDASARETALPASLLASEVGRHCSLFCCCCELMYSETGDMTQSMLTLQGLQTLRRSQGLPKDRTCHPAIDDSADQVLNCHALSRRGCTTFC